MHLASPGFGNPHRIAAQIMKVCEFFVPSLGTEICQSVPRSCEMSMRVAGEELFQAPKHSFITNGLQYL